MVPSCDDMLWSSTNSQKLFRYVLIKTGAMAGQTTSVFRRATCLLSQLNALEASTNRHELQPHSQRLGGHTVEKSQQHSGNHAWQPSLSLSQLPCE